MVYELNQAVAERVLEVVDAGLCSGKGDPKPGQMCVEAAVNFAMGLPHSDDPPCVGSAVRAFKIRLNDSRWSSDEARAAGMRKLAVAQLGSDTINQLEFAAKVVLKTIQRVLPKLLRLIGEKRPAKREEIEKLAVACEQATDLKLAREAAIDAKHYAYAAYAYAYAADAADAAAYAADAAAYAYAGRRHEFLLLSAEIGLEALIECGSPGCQWLFLCDAA